MKKFILPIILAISFLFFLPQNLNAQAEVDCRKIFNEDMKSCSIGFTACQDACSKETEKPDGTIYFNSGEIYKKCMKANDCEGKSSACNEQALANFRACGKSDKESTEAKKETPAVNVANELERFLDAAVDYFYQFDIREHSGSDREPFITLESGVKYSFPRSSALAYVQMDFVYLLSTEEPTEPLFLAPFKDAYYKNSTQDPVRLGYNFGDSTKRAELILSPSTEATFHLDQATSAETNTPPKIGLNYGEIEVKIDNTEPDRKFDIWTDFLGASAKFTHFWVSHDTDKRQSTVGVYEGEVEITTKDGKTITVKPDGDKPGVVVVSKKLSPVKLALFALSLAAVVGGIVWFVRRKKKK